MSVLVDTPLWSLALRRPAARLSPEEQRHVAEWTALVDDDEAVLIGPVRQEVLTGIRSEAMFERIRLALRDYPDELLSVEDFEAGAHAANVCRAAGVAGSTVDVLICGAALRREAAIYSLDRDFVAYARHLPLRLHAPRG